MNALICRKKKSITVHKIITLSINILRAEDVVICMHRLVIEKKKFTQVPGLAHNNCIGIALWWVTSILHYKVNIAS